MRARRVRSKEGCGSRNMSQYKDVRASEGEKMNNSLFGALAGVGPSKLFRIHRNHTLVIPAVFAILKH